MNQSNHISTKRNRHCAYAVSRKLSLGRVGAKMIHICKYLTPMYLFTLSLLYCYDKD